MKIFFRFQIISLALIPLSLSAQNMHKHHKNDILDTRKDLPLTEQMAQHQLSNMRAHLEAIQEVTAAMAKKDFALILTSAKKLSSSPEMTQMCEHIGQGVKGYTEMGLALHKAGDELVKAAEEKNMDKVIEKLSVTLQTCTSCHAAFKQKIKY